jgi:ABC-type molybdenum transport system ATPase subunit/photorepair protein PhrA
MNNEPIFSASHVSFNYEKVNVLTDISFTIQPGERVVILGKKHPA